MICVHFIVNTLISTASYGHLSSVKVIQALILYSFTVSRKKSGSDNSHHECEI